MITNPKYQIYQFDHTRADGTKSIRIVAVSSFAGKPVKGYADCHPNDEFSWEYGAALAIARCAEKVAAKRCKRAYRKVDEAKELVGAAIRHLEKMVQYEEDAEQHYNQASEDLLGILNLKQRCECGCDCNCGENCECGCHN